LIEALTSRHDVVPRGISLATVDIRQLKNRLGPLLRRVKDGERVTVTEGGRPVAVIMPAAGAELDPDVEKLLRAGLARWGGGKPRGSARPIKLRQGPPISQTVIEDRR
jgi:prevent-host-death family protein